MEFRYYVDGDKQFCEINPYEFLRVLKASLRKKAGHKIFNTVLSASLHAASDGQVPMLQDFMTYSTVE
jgi:hypothetical protein